MRVAEYYEFLRKREQIRLNRAANLLPPWTDDPILLEYKFTNVKRKHDRTSLKLRELFYDNHQHDDPEIILLNAATFRFFGTWEFAEALGWQTSFRPGTIIELATERLAAKQRVFTGAYVVTNGGISAPKQEVVVQNYLDGVSRHAEKIAQVARYTTRWEATIRELQKVPGFGGTGFMAKEVILDCMFTDFFGADVQDLNTWCPAGPGARRGVNRLMGWATEKRTSEKEALGIMKTLFSEREVYWPADWVELELHDIQFQLCEFDKYERVRNGEGRPRSRFVATPAH